MKKLNKNDITISADVSALGEEGGNVTIQTKIAKDIQSVTTNPETAAVTVTKSVSGGGNLPPSGGNSSSSGGGSSQTTGIRRRQAENMIRRTKKWEDSSVLTESEA